MKNIIKLSLFSRCFMNFIHAAEIMFSQEEIAVLESIVGFWSKDEKISTTTNQLLAKRCGYSEFSRPVSYDT